jgi:glycosyltransferase involved in cell wall biosynthesis
MLHQALSVARISVLLCTHNPDPGRLDRCLAGLSQQTLASHLWELLVIDNASTPPLARERFHPTGSAHVRLIREHQLGLTPARLAGIAVAKGDLLVLVDDDNVLAPDYLANARALMDAEPLIGAAGGILEGEFEVTPPHWIGPYLNLLGVRDFGPRPIRALIYNQVGPWEPIGAGMVIRRNVAQHYAQLARDPLRRQFDRRGAQLASCGDTDMARCAPELGYYLAYEPRLRLVHLIPAFRLRFGYMLRLVYGIKRSGILLDRLRTGFPSPLPNRWQRWLHFLANALRMFTPRLRLWLLRISALRGEIEARAIPLSQPSAVDAS